MDNLDQQLDELLAKRRQDMYSSFNRVLPTNELLFDRWEKARFLNAKEGTSIYDSSIIMGPVEIGSNVWIGPYTVLEGLNGKITIDDYVCISSGVMIFTHDSVKHFLTGGRAPYDSGDVSIGCCTQIGSMSMICAGVTIGKHCVIGANSFVNKSIPDHSIAFGNPAKVVGEVIIDGDNVTLKYFNKK